MKKNKITIYLRWGILAALTIWITIEAYLHQVLGGDKSPSIHALCPFGGIESLYQIFTTGSFISKIFSGTMILFVITIVLAIIFRRSFCGLLCPFGAIQEFFAKIGQLIFRKRFNIPKIIDKPMRYLKYVILVITVLYAWKTAGLWMAPYDPWSAYSHLSQGIPSVWAESAVGLIILGITIVGSILYDRFFCKYLCPMGALYGIVGKISPFKVARDANKCIDCGICSRKCPMNIDVQNVKMVKSAECINCHTCVLNCPEKGALQVVEGKKAINPLLAIALVLVLFFGSIFFFQAVGVYQLLPERIKAGETIKYSEIKGYMTIQDAAKATNTELEEFYKKFAIPGNVPANTKMKEISAIVPGYDFDKIKASMEDEALKSNNSEEDKTSENITNKSISDVKIDVNLVKGSITISAAAQAVNIDIKEFYKLFVIPDRVPSNTYMKDIVKLVPEYDLDKAKNSLR